MEINTTSEKQSIEKLLFSYRDALNISDVSKVLAVYTDDGVYMPPNILTSKGQQQLKSSYASVFKTIQLNIEFFIEEIIVNGKYAFAVTNSKSTILTHANRQKVVKENRELFVLQKENRQWKVARYMLNEIK